MNSMILFIYFVSKEQMKNNAIERLKKMASLEPEKRLKALVAYHSLNDENPMDFFGFIREQGSEVLFYYNEEENA